MNKLHVLCAALLCAVALLVPLAYALTTTAAPIVIAHRGASGERPEHSLVAYELGVMRQSDYIEADLLSTKDGVLVSFHDIELSKSTDVASHPEYANKRTEKVVDGVKLEGWFVDDFTHNELRTLHVRERYEFRSKLFDDVYGIVSFDEFVRFIKGLEKLYNRRIGMYIETKHSTYFKSKGVSLEDKVIQVLRTHNYCLNNVGRELDTCVQPKVYIQSFEASSLRYLRNTTSLPLIQLIGQEQDIQADTGIPFGQLTSPASLALIKSYADGIGPHKSLVLNSTTLHATPLVSNAHKNGLLVHVWTFRNESQFINSNFASSMEEEVYKFLGFGVDGIFADQPYIAYYARERFSPTRPPVYNQTVIMVLVNIGVFVGAVLLTLVALFIKNFIQERLSRRKPFAREQLKEEN